jgi:hypothetical protein
MTTIHYSNIQYDYYLQRILSLIVMNDIIILFYIKNILYTVYSTTDFIIE